MERVGCKEEPGGYLFVVNKTIAAKLRDNTRTYGRTWVMKRIHAEAILKTGVCKTFCTGILAHSAGNLIGIARTVASECAKGS